MASFWSFESTELRCAACKISTDALLRGQWVKKKIASVLWCVDMELPENSTLLLDWQAAGNEPKQASSKGCVCIKLCAQTITADNGIELNRSNLIIAEVHVDVRSHIFISPAAHPDYLFSPSFSHSWEQKTAQPESRDIDFGIPTLWSSSKREYKHLKVNNRAIKHCNFDSESALLNIHFEKTPCSGNNHSCSLRSQNPQNAPRWSRLIECPAI